MGYCETCSRHLNGALVCPGCGATQPTADAQPGRGQVADVVPELRPRSYPLYDTALFDDQEAVAGGASAQGSQATRSGTEAEATPATGARRPGFHRRTSAEEKRRNIVKVGALGVAAVLAGSGIMIGAALAGDSDAQDPLPSAGDDATASATPFPGANEGTSPPSPSPSSSAPASKSAKPVVKSRPPSRTPPPRTIAPRPATKPAERPRQPHQPAPAWTGGACLFGWCIDRDDRR